jgi:hypothetical protein
MVPVPLLFAIVIPPKAGGILESGTHSNINLPTLRLVKLVGMALRG